VPIYLHLAKPDDDPGGVRGLSRPRAGDLRLSGRDWRSCVAAGALGALRPLSLAHDHPRPYGRGAPLLPLAHR
jgi:hypothetical protein